MNAKLVIAAVVILIVIIVGGMFALGRNPASGQKSTSTSVGSTSANSTAMLLSASQYAPYSYQIYPGPMSAQARAAFSGYNLSAAKLLNGSALVNITVNGMPGRQSVVIRPGYRLYIIETSMGDDSLRFDSSLGDDGFALVNATGYVVQ